jgi:cobalt/nickel transport protein
MSRVSTRALVIAGLAIALVLAGVVSFYASGHPDGLEFVAEKTGFIDTAQDHAGRTSPFADYATSGVDNGRLSGGRAGVAGVAAVGVLFSGLVWVLRRHGKGD